ncbi:MAG TPA: DNA repair protein RecN [Candidatus Krumholzibacteria bacterium]|nr:DNA repair protein RecN [Candidatus Krumholzibacteria bacterium]
MLRRLRIENLAVVEDVTLELGPGLNVLTGSTGAGKSLIVGAVNLLLGERATPDVIRLGEDEARVEAEFDPIQGDDLAALVHLMAPREPVRLTRRVGRNGRSTATVNGRTVPLKDLRAACARLIEPHGQNVQYQLRDPAQHIEYIDAFAGNDAPRAAFAAELAALRDAQSLLARHDADVAAVAEKRELYAHRIEEIGRVAPRVGEKDELETRARLFAHAEKLYTALEATCGALYDDDHSASSLAGECARRLMPLGSIDPRIATILDRLAQVAVLLEEAAAQARDVLDGLEFEPSDVERVQERLEALARLERRYNATIDSLLEQKAVWEAAIDELGAGPERRERLAREVTAAAERVAKAGRVLTESRLGAAVRMDQLVTDALQRLSMRGASFRTAIAYVPDPSSPVRVGGAGVACGENGLDTVRMFIRANPGEAEGGLDAIASTGELSRVALVLKQLAASGLPGSTLIFDEIDAGVGADLGDALAENLLALAKYHQIICITHMPQIAARGQSHLVVRKEIDGDRTRVRVTTAAGDQRTREIARMLGGDEGSDRRRALAAELLGTPPGDHRK